MSAAVLLGLTAIAVAKPHNDFQKDSHRFDHGSSFGKHDDDKWRGKFDKHHGYREPDQIQAFQNLFRRTGTFVLSCTQHVWWTVASPWDRFHWKRPHRRYADNKPVSPSKPGHHHPGWHKPHGDKPHDGSPDDGYTPPDQGKPNGPQIADTSDKPDWYEPEPDRPIPVPEPGSLAVLGSALLTGWLLRRRHRTS